MIVMSVLTSLNKFFPEVLQYNYHEFQYECLLYNLPRISNVSLIFLISNDSIVFWLPCVILEIMR